MAMFLMMLGHNQRFSVIKRRFQHSKQTIHKYFHEVLATMMEFAKEVIVPTSNPDTPRRNKRLRRVFKGAIGALDGTLIHAIVPVHKQHLYRGRGKGECYQNVLAICDFNMVFTFLVAGWEGVAHDSRILSESLTNANAPFPLPPPGTFSNIKKMAPFSLVTQRNITIACFALHNFIRKEGLSDDLFDEYDHPNVRFQDGDEDAQDNGEEGEARHGSAADREFMSQLRDQIAQQLMQNNVL
ncbi:uncharacterized protein LOC143597426 [Bidens hawaiensis]|uniref:uncharacterized protein LOC143597426 n=1 Tax=Bidens hawaiensis TaxID=980011 RepID=UPI00404B0212